MSWNDDEAIEAERWEADQQQAELEAAGNRHWRRIKKMRALRAAGKLAEAAEMCPHGHGYPLNSLAAEHNNDPRKGEAGVRCHECGSVLTEWSPALGGNGVVLYPCELPLPKDD